MFLFHIDLRCDIIRLDLIFSSVKSILEENDPLERCRCTQCFYDIQQNRNVPSQLFGIFHYIVYIVSALCLLKQSM